MAEGPDGYPCEDDISESKDDSGGRLHSCHALKCNGFNNIQHILTNQSVPSHVHCMKQKEQEDTRNCCHTEVGSFRPYPLLFLRLSTERLTLLSLSLSSPHMQEFYPVFSCTHRVQNIACQALCYFEVCIPQASIRYGS
jgi:hypothetical protein